MTEQTARNLLLYIGSVVLGSVAAGLGVLIVQLTGTDPIQWRPVIVAVLGPIVTGLLATQLSRVGGEGIASQVDLLHAQGIPRHEMVVVSQDEAVHGIAPPTDRAPLTADQLEQVYADMRRRMGAP